MFSLLCICNQWATVIQCKFYIIPAYVIQLKCCLDALKLYPLYYKKTCTHNWDYKYKDIFAQNFKSSKQCIEIDKTC